MKATWKAKRIDDLLTAFTGNDRATSVVENTCAVCNGVADSFVDDLSKREYKISGMCQKCQDAVFNS
jgi:hypothetical protein